MAEKSDDGKGSTAQSRKAHNLKVALHFAQNGVPVLLLKDKVPLTLMFGERDCDIDHDRREARRAKFVAKHGHEPVGIGSTTDEAIIRRWWRNTPGELAAGISPGLCSALVLDCDNKEGDNGDAALLRAHLAEHGLTLDLARTPIVASGRREGRHAWFRNLEGLGNGVARALKADWKGVGGQVVAPGSLLPPAPDGDGSPMHYRPIAGAMDLVEAIRTSALPELPACLRSLHGGNTGARPKPEFPELQAEIEAGLEIDMPEAEIAALADEMRSPTFGVGQLWDQPSPDHSDNRWKLAQALRGRRGSQAVTVHHYVALLERWDGAGAFSEYRGQGLYAPYDIAREWGKNADVRPIVTGEEFGDVEAQEMSAPDGRSAGDEAFSSFLEAVLFDEDPAAAEAIVRRQMKEDSLSAAAAKRLDAMLGGIRAGTWKVLPSNFESLRAAVTAPEGPIYETRASLRARVRKPTLWLIADMIAANTVFLIHGREGTGKTLIATDISYHVAYGRDWAGRKVKRAGVLYVCPEGPDGFVRRQDAWHIRQAAIGFSEDDGPIETRRVATDMFTSDADFSLISKQVQTFRQRHDVGCALIVFDTMRQVTPGADENSAKDVGVFTAKLARLRDLHGCAVGFVHHETKDPSEGAAGSTAVTSNVDAAFSVKADKGALMLVPGKQRDSGSRDVVRFQVVEWEAGLNTDGVMERAPVAVVELPKPGQRPSDGSAMGAVDEEGQAEAVALPDPVDLTPIPRDPEDTARHDLILRIVSEAPDQAIKFGDMLSTFNARRRRGRKDPLSRTVLQDIVSDLIEMAPPQLQRIGTGNGRQIALPDSS